MAAPTDQLTPLFRQYWEIKRQYPDVILMFRLGDFLEMFGEDAETAARALEITLTSRDYVGGERIPMCGVPYHAHERYVARLIAAGYRVAICDQVEDPRFAKGLVRRKVTRVVTPGTVLEDSMLEAKANNYLVAVAAAPPEAGELRAFGLAVCDVSTGEFAVTEIRGAEASRRLAEELDRLAPRELLLPEALAESCRDWLAEGRPWTITPLPSEPFQRKSARQALLDHFGVHTLQGFGCEGMELAIEAARSVLDYLNRRHIDAARHLRTLATYSTDQFMALDATARRNLELTQTMWEGGRSRTLLSVLDATCTAMGGRLLRRWIEQPLLDPARIDERLDAVQELAEQVLLRGDLRERLSGIGDLERLASRCATGAATPRDLAKLRDSLQRLPELQEWLAPARSVYLSELAARLEPLGDLTERLEAALVDEPPAAIRDGGVIREGYSPHLDALRRAALEGKDWIAGLEARERERTGIKSLKVGYNNVFGYYIEVTKPNLHLVPPDYHRKQTTAGGERYITPELKDREREVLGAEEKILELEETLFRELREAVGREAPRILAVAGALAEVDVLAAFAETSVRNGYARPRVDTGDEIFIRNGRHPVVEKLGSEPFVPNDALLDCRENRLLIITGPNMAGKCVASDTLVFTDRGLVRIADLVPTGAREGEFGAIRCRVRAPGGRREATHLFVGGRQATVRLTTRAGYRIEGTPEHRVWVRFADGTEGWRRLGEVAPGDCVAIETQIDLWGSDTRIAPFPDEPEGSIRRHRLPAVLDGELGYLMGLLVGRGTLTRKAAVVLAATEEDIAARFASVVERLFGCRPRCPANGKERYLASRRIRRFLARLGLGYHRAHEKRVPHAILRAPREIVVAFLQGLFDTDGRADARRGEVQWATASERLAREVQLLLLNLGIVASLHASGTARRPGYLLSICGEDARRFHRTVGLWLARERAPAESVPDVRLPNVVRIPQPAGARMGAARILSTAGKPAALRCDERPGSISGVELRNGCGLSRWRLDAWLACPGEIGGDGAGLHARRYFYDLVATVEAGEADVYDLSVEEEHAYVANGFVSHNSTYLRQVALIVLMAQAGCFVPADEARIGVVDRIFTRVGAHDDLASGQSTFMVEMTETASILNHVTNRSLVILDEIGRGTSTYDGLSIAWAVAEYLQQVGARTLFATHYHHLNDLADRLPGVRNYRVAVKEDGHHIIWLRKIVPGGTDRSYGIQVARLAGLPEAVIARAREVLEDLESGGPTANGGIPPREARITERRQRLQLSLFEAEEHPVLEELRRLDLSTMTPIEALTVLYQLQKKLR